MQADKPTMRLLPQWASLNRMVLDLFKLYEPAFAVKRVGTGLDLDPALALTWADRAQLELGVGSLVSHAVKHTGRGGLIMCRTAMDGEWAKLTIGDNGPGISAAEALSLFDDRGDERPAGEHGGALELSQRIIAAHGGQIELDTSYDSGTWFVVRLPAIASENARLIDELEQTKQGKFDLAANMSYELRTPLNVIMGYTDLLLDGAFESFNAHQLDTLRRIDRSARELLRLINASIDMRCLDAGRSPLELPDGHLPELIRGFCQFAAEALGCDMSHMWLWQPASDVYVPVAGHGDTPEQEIWIRSLRISKARVARVLPASEYNDVTPVAVVEPRDLFSSTAYERCEMTRCLVVPLRRGGETLAVLTAGYRGRAHSFTDEQARRARGIADLSAMALENARLVTEIAQTERMKADFVSNMSHHFRMPLNAIIGYTDLLLDGEFGGLTREQANVLSRLRKSGIDLFDAVTRTLDPHLG